ncbi:MAG TPA: alpha/beta hydrolase [Terriglobales bacterium]|nr:alpha/beta hydrolase [Terriglobales bacterium]
MPARKITASHLLLASILLWSALTAAADASLQRQDFFVPGDPDIRLFVREVSASGSAGQPILLLHGARVPGLASFDLSVQGGSLAADLAQSGLDVYVMDVRGYGRSTRPEAMQEPPAMHAPLVRSNEAAHDIGAVIDAIRERRHVSRVALFGWATGGQWAGYYASIYPKKVSALIVLNSLYRGNSKQPMIGRGSDLEDPIRPGQFNQAACEAYRWSSAESLTAGWDRSIPIADKNAWRDPAVAQAYVEAALASDPESSSQNPPAFRSPCGALEDSFYLATGRQLWDASLITAPTLILASERDFWSRPEDRQNLEADLVHAARVRTVVIPGATHFVHLDRGDRGRDLLLREVEGFLGAARQPGSAH